MEGSLVNEDLGQVWDCSQVWERGSCQAQTQKLAMGRNVNELKPYCDLSGWEEPGERTFAEQSPIR